MLTGIGSISGATAVCGAANCSRIHDHETLWVTSSTVARRLLLMEYGRQKFERDLCPA
jgi:hypothetical protein